MELKKFDSEDAEGLFSNVKVSLEDYHGQTGDRITKKLIRESVKSMNHAKLPGRMLKSVRERLEGVFL